MKTRFLPKKSSNLSIDHFDAVSSRPTQPRANQEEHSVRLKVHALTDFLRSNKIEVLKVAGPRESTETGQWMRYGKRASRVGEGRVGDCHRTSWVSRYFRLEPV